jgi:alpha-tubulin suppressor-like RCC1 family protein
VSEAVGVPADSGKRAVEYRFHLSVTGTKTVNAKAVTLTVAAGGLPTAIVAGAEHTCALLAGGTVECWGENASGQLGNGTTINAYTPEAVSGLSGSTAVSGGTFADHSCALLSGGTVECWGDNQYGQLGNGTTTESTTPVAVSGLTGTTAVSGGEGSTCALLSGGTVECWGDNQYGQLGNGTTTESTTPVAVFGLSGATAIAVEDDHACALLAGGAVDCWGYNAAGQLGDGTTTGPDHCAFINRVPTEPCSTTPTAANLSGATAIAGGDGGSCALLAGGSVDCWGENDYGLLGNGTFSSSSGSATPTAVSGINHATAIAGLGGAACALLGGGTVDCWGANIGGELGDGTISGPETCTGSIPCNTLPGAVIGLNGATAIAGGGTHACALLVGGSIDCWGDNAGGDLGDGTKRANLPTPVPVKRLP